MIRTDFEYQESVRRLAEEKVRISEYRKRLKGEGLAGAKLKRVLDPVLTFHHQLAEEVAAYERLRQGEVGEVLNLHGLGRMLVGLRVSLGLSQRELAGRLGIHESQVSRDERNEYHGITVERASRVLDALGVQVSTKSASLAPGAKPVAGRQSKAG